MKQRIDLRGKRILVTGSPGFIGANLVCRLLQENLSNHIFSLDSLNDYYDVALKKYRLSIIDQQATTSNSSHSFLQTQIAEKDSLFRFFSTYKPQIVIHLAAQAGVRYSISHPDDYIS